SRSGTPKDDGAALAALRDRYQQLEVVVRQAAPGAALADLDAHEVDIAVVDDWSDAAPAERPGCDARRLLRDPVALALPRSHPAAKAAGPIELSEVSEDAWICAPPGEPSRDAFDRVMADAGIRPVVGWEFQGLTTIAALIGHGVGIALLPRLAVTFSSATDDIVLREPSIALARHFDAVTRTAARDRPAIQTVVGAIADELAVHRTA
ncbi:MAG: LysR substrate-binding domain-containing protein, partial [Actinomycetota bacterium]